MIGNSTSYYQDFFQIIFIKKTIFFFVASNITLLRNMMHLLKWNLKIHQRKYAFWVYCLYITKKCIDKIYMIYYL